MCLQARSPREVMKTQCLKAHSVFRTSCEHAGKGLRRPPKKGGGGQYGDSGTGFDDLYKPNPEDDYGVGGPTARLWNSTESVDALVAGQSSGTYIEVSPEPAFASFGASFDSFTPSKDVFGAGFEVASDLQSANSFAPAKADFTNELAMV